jgi:hypothetical protein
MQAMKRKRSRTSRTTTENQQNQKTERTGNATMPTENATKTKPTNAVSNRREGN